MLEIRALLQCFKGYEPEIVAAAKGVYHGLTESIENMGVARQEMDLLDHRFLYFIDADDGRGKVLYLRYDGDYGLVEPG